MSFALARIKPDFTGNMRFQGSLHTAGTYLVIDYNFAARNRFLSVIRRVPEKEPRVVPPTDDLVIKLVAEEVGANAENLRQALGDMSSDSSDDSDSDSDSDSDTGNDTDDHVVGETEGEPSTDPDQETEGAASPPGPEGQEVPDGTSEDTLRTSLEEMTIPELVAKAAGLNMATKSEWRKGDLVDALYSKLTIG